MESVCPQCGKPVAANAAGGVCGACLMQLGLSATHQLESSTPFEPPSVEELRQHFPKLDIFELVGHGGMGAVYKARQRDLDRFVALKILPSTSGMDPVFAERFHREAKALARLVHPGIVTVFDVDTSGPYHYLTMEFVDGVNLRHAIESGTITADQALEIVPQICDALQYAHDEGVVHRDIKPENILLDQRGRIKIADFGLAKLLGRTPINLTLTASHQVMGTLHYMAPEQIERPLDVDHRADIYSLGVVFYELLTGQLPLGRFDLPSEKCPIDNQLDDVVLKTLERNPAVRYQQASQLKTDVEGLSSPDVPAAPRASSVRNIVPFVLSYQGARGATGVARVDDDSLVLEFRIEDYAKYYPGFKGFKKGDHEVRIPLSEIADINYEDSWTGIRVTLQSHQMKSVSDVPSSSSARVVLHIARRDERDAINFVNLARKGLGLPTIDHPASGITEEQRADSNLRTPSMFLLVIGTFNILLPPFLLSMQVAINKVLDSIWLIFCGSATFVGIAMVIGAIAMQRRRSYPLATMGAIAGLAPLTPLVFVSSPFSIIALIMLNRPFVRSSFRDQHATGSTPQLAATAPHGKSGALSKGKMPRRNQQAGFGAWMVIAIIIVMLTFAAASRSIVEYFVSRSANATITWHDDSNQDQRELVQVVNDRLSFNSYVIGHAKYDDQRKQLQINFLVNSADAYWQATERLSKRGVTYIVPIAKQASDSTTKNKEESGDFVERWLNLTDHLPPVDSVTRTLGKETEILTLSPVDPIPCRISSVTISSGSEFHVQWDRDYTPHYNHLLTQFPPKEKWSFALIVDGDIVGIAQKGEEGDRAVFVAPWNALRMNNWGAIIRSGPLDAEISISQ